MTLFNAPFSGIKYIQKAYPSSLFPKPFYHPKETHLSPGTSDLLSVTPPVPGEQNDTVRALWCPALSSLLLGLTHIAAGAGASFLFHGSNDTPLCGQNPFSLPICLLRVTWVVPPFSPCEQVTQLFGWTRSSPGPPTPEKPTASASLCWDRFSHFKI